jgi:hypothetical protein
MTRTIVAVLVGLLVCSTAWAEEPHEKWLKYVAGEWRSEATTFKPWTGKFSLVPGHHALLGTGHAEDTGETAEIIAWEPDKKTLVHTWYGKKNAAYSRYEYTKVTDSELSGNDSGVSPGGRPYSGVISVRRADDDTITFAYSGKYKDGKEYKGTGKTVRIKREGKVSPAKALKDFGDLAVGGVWTTTDRHGNKLEDRWEWILNTSFLKLTSKSGNKTTSLSLGGIDPATGRVTFWTFDDEGRVYKGIDTLDGESRAEGQGPKGRYSLRTKVTIVRPDEVRWECLEGSIIDGKPVPYEKQTWIRKK